MSIGHERRSGFNNTRRDWSEFIHRHLIEIYKCIRYLCIICIMYSYMCVYVYVYTHIHKHKQIVEYCVRMQSCRNRKVSHFCPFSLIKFSSMNTFQFPKIKKKNNWQLIYPIKRHCCDSYIHIYMLYQRKTNKNIRYKESTVRFHRTHNIK